MKGMVRFVMVLGILGIITECGLAQGVSITSDDVKAAYVVGNKVTYHLDTLTKNVNIGTPNGSGVYDFSGLKSNALRILKSVTKSSSPYAAEFPSATYAFLDSAFAYRINTGTLGFGWGTIKSSAAYLYYSIDTDQRFHGVGAVASGYLDQMPTVPIAITNPRWRNTPPSTDFHFPVEYGKSWTSVFVDSLLGSIFFFTNYDVKIGNTDSITYVVDGYGTLTVPGGYTQDALRIRKVGRYSFIDSVNNMNIPLQYIYLAKNGASVEIGIDDTTVTSGTANIRYAKWTAPLPTGVDQGIELAQSFALEQNYPNPFNPTTNIGFRVSGLGSTVKLSVFDMLGREVAVLVNEKKDAGTYTATWNAAGMPSGVYFYRLTTDGFTATRSAVLLK
jgi:hypothetical protein